MRSLALLAVFALAASVLAGCIGTQVEEPDQPIQSSDNAFELLPPPAEVLGLEHVAGIGIEGVNELTLRDGIAYLSGAGGAFIIDVRDPANPVELSSVPCRGIHVRTIQLEARLLMTISSQNDDTCDGAAPAGGVRLVDVTDPSDPIVGPQVPLAFGSHTHTPYGDTGIIYNSAYNIYTNFAAHNNPEQHMRTEIIDVSDWTDPKVVKEFTFPTESTSPGCHDFWTEPQRDRAICAAITETQIWDTSDPLNPSVKAIIRNPLLTIHHSAATARDGDLLLIGEEWTGALGPGCFDGGLIAPMGSIWFYDISDDTAPEMLSYFAPPHQGPGIPCTAHNFNIIEGRDVAVAAFFTGGTVLIDFSDPANPAMIDQYLPDNTDVWAAYYHHGHVFTGDRGRGLDVLGFQAAGQTAAAGKLILPWLPNP